MFDLDVKRSFEAWFSDIYRLVGNSKEIDPQAKRFKEELQKAYLAGARYERGF